MRCQLKYSNSIAALVASALAHFDSHFAPYLPCFQSLTRSVEDAARLYLHGLFQCRRRNMEKMAETVCGSRYQRLHHMLSESAWERGGVRRQLIADANAHFGHACALVIDEAPSPRRATCRPASPVNGTVAWARPTTASRRLRCRDTGSGGRRG
ncbi:MAG: transposase [Sterolibacteriaceae bacterium]|nr:transposase [Sterolibacteriaceae bacterium]